MNCSNLNASHNDQIHLQACLARYQRCKQKLDFCNRALVRQWLDALPDGEREQCRTVLNNLVAVRRNKRGQHEKSI
ncbi:hypothetical protein HQQ94_08275 [Shewanella sp. VB17]|uniref:hypothetical protein n=1 Tax=Shewanella sp. VB17 TaxID=2739432 RepID=UPI001565B5B8|nr:hypothetical protein [Shewanella sp. VB17]NRD73238.1 hypothetical protein [Shewanella sp. VB17]